MDIAAKRWAMLGGCTHKRHSLLLSSLKSDGGRKEGITTPCVMNIRTEKNTEYSEHISTLSGEERWTKISLNTGNFFLSILWRI